MSENKKPSLKKVLITISAIVAVVWFLFFRSPGSFAASLPVIGNILIVAIGFGAVIMIHEFGHFIVAKVSGIKVTAFSIGFPPTLLGIQKLEDGIRFRFLPKFFPKNTGNDDDDGLIFFIPGKHTPSPTEYRISLIPFGGFVKMLGQEDSGPVEETNDPRSFANKSTTIKIAVVAAGVVFNAISAVLVFMIVFLVGVELMPAVVGKVRPNSPAAIAGIRDKDRIVEVNGETFVDYMSLTMASMLSDNANPLELKVQRPDGTIEDITVIAEESDGSNIPGRQLGIIQPKTLNVAKGLRSKDVKTLYETTALKPEDRFVAFDGKQIKDAWELDDLVENSFKSSCVLTVERTDGETNETSMINTDLSLAMERYTDNFKTGADTTHIYSMIPRLKINMSWNVKKEKSLTEKAAAFWKYTILKQTDPEEGIEPDLKPGDVIVQTGSIVSPTWEQLQDVVKEYADKPLLVKVLRKNDMGQENILDIVVTPRKVPGTERVMMGVAADYDAEHAVVAETIDIKNGPSALEIPKGATITHVDGQEVRSFFDVINIIKKNKGQRISIEFVTADGSDAGGTGLEIPVTHDYITAQMGFADAIPLDYHEEVFKADSPAEAITMGVKQTKMFIVNSYLTMKGLFSQKIKKEAVSGPVGIVTISYFIADTKSFAYFAYFMGLISSCLAFMNLLPIPVVDGGVILLLIVEKIKGSPISQKTQEVISYAGLAFIIALFVWLTFNDISTIFRR